jgi:signal peptidase II
VPADARFDAMTERPAGAAAGAPGREAVSRGALGLLAIAIVALDQISKALVRELLPLHDSVMLVPGLVNFTHVRNTGAAFGLLNAVDIPFKPVLMTLIAVVALAAIALYAWRSTSDEPASRIGLVLILSGAVGNLIDRVTAGHVVDFVDVYWRDYHFWAFNVADSAITVGAVLLIVDMLFLGRHVSTTA